MHWDNIKGSYASNMWAEAWETTPDSELPAVCDDSGLTGDATRDFSNCYSGSRVSAYGYAYDFESVMHYSLDAFAVDRTRNVMTPLDATVTTIGGETMSAMDIKKLKAAYNCQNAEVNSCGGYFKGDSGTIAATDSDDSCNWLIEVETGYAIEITTTGFQADCPNALEFRNGNTKASALIKSYCGTDKPSFFVSPDSFLYISWSKTGAGQSFSLSWKKVLVTCCDQIKLESTGPAGTQNGQLMVTYTHTSGDDINDRPVYRNGNKYIAHSGSYWAVSSTDYGTTVGSGSAVMIGSGSSACPTGAGVWEYIVNGAFTPDDQMKAVCDVACPVTIPTAPTGATVEWNNEVTVGTVVTYTCSATDLKYAVCGSDAAWTPATIPACDTVSVTTAPTAAPTAAPTEAPSCENKKGKIPFLKVLKQVKKVKTAAACKSMCMDLEACEYWAWKTNRKVAKRICKLQAVAFKNGKGWTSGEIFC